MRILIVKLGALGDVVIWSGMMHAIVRRHPDAEFVLMTHAAFVPIMRQSGWFSDFIVDNRKPYRWAELKRICYDSVVRREFDLVYDLQSSHRTLKVYYPLVRLLSRKRLVWISHGYQAVEWDVRTSPAKRMLSWGRDERSKVALAPLPGDLGFCHGERRNFGLLPESPFLLLIPGCSAANSDKRWPAANYAAVSDRFRRLGIRSVVLGTKSESDVIREILRGSPSAVDFMDKATLADIPDLARKAAAVVGNDTGPTHMARLAGARTVMLFNERTRNSAAEGRNVVNLFGREIADISVESVVARLEAWLCA